MRILRSDSKPRLRIINDGGGGGGDDDGDDDEESSGHLDMPGTVLPAISIYFTQLLLRTLRK